MVWTKPLHLVTLGQKFLATMLTLKLLLYVIAKALSGCLNSMAGQLRANLKHTQLRYYEWLELYMHKNRILSL